MDNEEHVLKTIGRRSVIAATAALAVPRRPARAQETRDVLRIGILTDLSGQYRDNSGPTTVLAAKQAVEDFQPEQHGFTVEIKVADHHLKADVGSSIARQWFGEDGVDAIADVNSTAIALAVNTIAESQNKVVLITGAASPVLTGASCSQNTVHFTPDSWGTSFSTGNAVLAAGGDKWFLILPDYSFGHILDGDISALVEKRGGRVLGRASYPFPQTTDFSSYMLQAQSSGATVLGLCNTGGDMENCVKQAHEFGLTQNGIKIATLLGFVTEVHSMGLEIAQDLLISETFYWDLNDRTRAFAMRFVPKTQNNYPNSLHASCYAGITHYLKAVAALGPARAKASGRQAVTTMKQLPTDDDCFGVASIRDDGRFLCPVNLFQVKKPNESRGPWDLYKLLHTTPGDVAWRPLSDGACQLTANGRPQP